MPIELVYRQSAGTELNRHGYISDRSKFCRVCIQRYIPTYAVTKQRILLVYLVTCTYLSRALLATEPDWTTNKIILYIHLYYITV